METPSDDESCLEADLVGQALQYVSMGTYPMGCPENRKRTIRKKSKKFEVHCIIIVLALSGFTKTAWRHLKWHGRTMNLHGDTIVVRSSYRP